MNVLDNALTEQNAALIQLKKELNDSYRYIVDVNLSHLKKENETKTEYLVENAMKTFRKDIVERCEDLINGNNIKLKREIHDRFDSVTEKIDYSCLELRDVKDKAGKNIEEMKDVKLELRKLQLTVDSNKETIDSELSRLRKQAFELQERNEMCETKRLKLDKDLEFIRNDCKRRLDTFDDTLVLNSKELSQKIDEVQEQLELYQSSIKHEQTLLHNLATQTIERVAEIKHSLASRQQDLFENQEKKIQKMLSQLNGLKDQLDRDLMAKSGELNYTMGSKLESLSKTLYGESKSLNERIFDIEKSVENHQRNSQEILVDIENEVKYKHDSLSRALSKICEYSRIPNHLIF